MPKAGKIEASLNVGELREFIERLKAGPRPTLRDVQSLATEYGIEVSLPGASTFRNNVFDRELDRLRAAQDFAFKIAGIQEQGAGNTIADAGAAIIAQEAFDILSNPVEGGFSAKQLKDLSLTITRLRTANQREQYLQARLREMEAKEQKRQQEEKRLKDQLSKSMKKEKGISPETQALFDQMLGLS